MVRLNRIHPERQRTLLMKVVSPFLLYGGEAHLRRLQEMTTDSVVNEVLWKEMLSQVTDEWRDFIVYVRLYHYSTTRLIKHIF
jgi:hypothetical protein